MGLELYSEVSTHKFGIGWTNIVFNKIHYDELHISGFQNRVYFKAFSSSVWLTTVNGNSIWILHVAKSLLQVAVSLAAAYFN